jgi:hypothetical protein
MHIIQSKKRISLFILNVKAPALNWFKAEQKIFDSANVPHEANCRLVQVGLKRHMG